MPEESPEEAASPIKEYLPLIITIVLMPVIAFCMTQFILIPKLKPQTGGTQAESTELKGEEGGHNTAKKESGHGGGHGGGHKDDSAEPVGNTFKVDKVIVNVRNSVGRFLLASFTVSGSDANLATLMKQREAQIKDLTIDVLMTLAVEDIAQPDIKNRVKASLITSFNMALGGEFVQNIYFTEFAIQ